MQSSMYLLLASAAVASASTIEIGCGVGNHSACTRMSLTGSASTRLNVMDTETSVQLTFPSKSNPLPSIASYRMESVPMSSSVVMNENQKIDYDSAEAEDSYGTKTEVGVRVRGPGSEAVLYFDFEIEAVTVDDILKDARDEYNSLSKEDQAKIDKSHFEAKAGIDGLFKVLEFSVGLSGGFSHEDSNTKHSYTEINKQDNLLRKIYDTTKQTLRVHGHVKAVCKSYLPQEAYAMVRIMHITYSNGETQTIIESSENAKAVRAADKNGETKGLETDVEESKLNVRKIK